MTLAPQRWQSSRLTKQIGQAVKKELTENRSGGILRSVMSHLNLGLLLNALLLCRAAVEV
jgi:hypothetical protein